MRSRRDLIETLYALHYEPLLRFAYLLAGSHAEDLVQEAFVQALRKWDPDSPPEAFRSWAQKTLLRRHLSMLRSASRELRALARLKPREIPQVEPEDALDVRSALARLSPRQRAALLLRYFEDLPEREIADRLGCRPGTVKALLHQAKQRLRAPPRGVSAKAE